MAMSKRLLLFCIVASPSCGGNESSSPPDASIASARPATPDAGAPAQEPERAAPAAPAPAPPGTAPGAVADGGPSIGESIGETSAEPADAGSDASDAGSVEECPPLGELDCSETPTCCEGSVCLDGSDCASGCCLPVDAEGGICASSDLCEAPPDRRVYRGRPACGRRHLPRGRDQVPHRRQRLQCCRHVRERGVPHEHFQPGGHLRQHVWHTQRVHAVDTHAARLVLHDDRSVAQSGQQEHDSGRRHRPRCAVCRARREWHLTRSGVVAERASRRNPLLFEEPRRVSPNVEEGPSAECPNFRPRILACTRRSDEHRCPWPCVCGRRENAVQKRPSTSSPATSGVRRGMTRAVGWVLASGSGSIQKRMPAVAPPRCQ